jgi:hypothetical protein
MIEDLSYLTAIEELRSLYYQPSAPVRRGYRGADRADVRDNLY